MGPLGVLFGRYALLSLLLFACSGSEESGGGSDAGKDVSSDSAGGTSTGGSGGASGGSDCAEGLPCKSGTTCFEKTGPETHINCGCDPSAHWMCDIFGGAGATSGCNEINACHQGGTCKQDNGFCVLSCTCEAGSCAYDCNNAGG